MTMSPLIVVIVAAAALTVGCDMPAERALQRECDAAGGVVVVTDIGEGTYECLLGDNLRILP